MRLDTTLWCLELALMPLLQGRQLEEQQDVEPAKLLWEEDFSDAGSTRLSEKDWSFHTGNGSEFGIPGKVLPCLLVLAS